MKRRRWYWCTCLQKGKKSKKRQGVHEILKRRDEFGEFHHLVQELHFHPERFRQYFRMTEDQFDYVLDLIKDDISKLDTNWKKSYIYKRTPLNLLEVSYIDMSFLNFGSEKKNTFIFNKNCKSLLITVCDFIQFTGLPSGRAKLQIYYQSHAASKSYLNAVFRLFFIFHTFCINRVWLLFWWFIS